MAAQERLFMPRPTQIQVSITWAESGWRLFVRAGIYEGEHGMDWEPGEAFESLLTQELMDVVDATLFGLLERIG